MTKQELITYIVGIMTKAMEDEFPPSANKEYIMPEYMMIDMAAEIINNKFNHIRKGIFSSYMIDQKGEKHV